MTEKPEGIEQRDWDDACSAMDRAGWFMRSVRVECAKAILQARSQAYEEIYKLIGEANAKLGGIETPAMRGDNLAVTLCTHFDDGEPSDDDTGWSRAAIDGYEQVMAAIKDHYSQAIRQHSQKGEGK